MITIGPLVVTSVELSLYATLGLWGLVVVRCRGRGSSGHDFALGAFAVIVLLSALTADVHRAAAVKFAARTLGGCLLAVATADLARTDRERARVVAALAMGAVVSGTLGIAELWWPGADNWLLRFKTQPSFVAGWRRASGTFQYANTAAMFWEASIPLALVAGVWRSGARARLVPLLAATAAAVLLAQAIVLSASRAGWWGAGGALGLLLVLAWRRVSVLRLPGLVALGALVALPFVRGPLGGLTAERLRAGDPRTWYGAEYRDVPRALSVPAGGEASVTVSVRNTGRLAWPSGGPRPVALSYHWFDATGEWVVAFEGIRSPLPREVSPREDVAVQARVVATMPPGRYRLKWDLVHEHVTWFSALGGAMPETEVTVQPAERTVRLPPRSPLFRYRPVVRPPRLDLWRAALVLWRTAPWLGIGPDNFRRMWGPRVDGVTFDDRIHANSLYIELLVTVGLVGLVTFLAIVGGAGIALVRAIAGPPERRDLPLVLGVTAALAAFLAHGAVDYFLAFTPTYGLFWVLVGLARSAAATAPSIPRA